MQTVLIAEHIKITRTHNNLSQKSTFCHLQTLRAFYWQIRKAVVVGQGSLANSEAVITVSG